MVKLLATICIVATCIMMLATAPSGCPTTTDCSSLVYDLIDCMEFLVAGGSETAPDDSCCLGFKTLMETNEDCMCYALDASASFGLDINMTRAEALPTDCVVSSPPISTCHVSTSPVESPGIAAKSPIISAPTLPPVVGSPVRTPASPAPMVSPTSMVYGPVEPPSEKAGACAISATFLALLSIILIFLV